MDQHIQTRLLEACQAILQPRGVGVVRETQMPDCFRCYVLESI